MNKFDDDVDVFANVHADRKQFGATRHKNKKQKKDAERKVKAVSGKERWRFDPKHNYEED
jgi:hypothetical protein